MTNNILVGGALGSVLFAVLGVLVMTSEYSSGTIRATLAAIPQAPAGAGGQGSRVRGRPRWSPASWSPSPCFLAGAAFVHGGVPRPALSQPDVLRAVVLSGAYLCLIGLIGLALGAIIRHGAAAITALVGRGVRRAAGRARGHPGRAVPPRAHLRELARRHQTGPGFHRSPRGPAWASSPPTPSSCSPSAAGSSPAATPRPMTAPAAAAGAAVRGIAFTGRARRELLFCVLGLPLSLPLPVVGFAVTIVARAGWPGRPGSRTATRRGWPC